MKKLIYILSLSLNLGLTAQDCELPSPYTNGSTGNNLTTLLHSSFLEPLDLTSTAPYIVALTPAGLIVGSACIASDCLSGGMQSVAIWGDDTLTPDIDGAQEGELITFKIVDGTDLNLVISSPITYTANGTILIASGSMNFECIGTVEGCTDALACNYNDLATVDNGSCEMAEEYYDCDGNCNTDTDGDGICDELEILGCIEPMACNYNSDATEEIECIYPELYYNCDGECINDDDNDGICNEEEELGCTNNFACNYDAEATDDDGSCFVVSAELTYDIDNNILSVSMDQITEPLDNKACSFERIYFSRGNDADIYTERKELGKLICPKVMESIGGDLKNSVFSFIPNTAETSFYGMVKGLELLYKDKQAQMVLDLGDHPTTEQIKDIFSVSPRIEKIAIKDAKLRTFITDDNNRDSLVGHVYDITYGQVSETDNLVMIDDSIVRGTTLKKSILKILDRLNPKKIVIVSSAPQIRYPDCYGIDMARMGDFIAFRAAIELLKDRGMEYVIQEVYQKCKAQIGLPSEEVVNHVKGIYSPFSPEEISAKCVELLRPDDITAEVEIIFQGIDELHQACPNHKGDWYFTGDYPTQGGNMVVNKAFMYYVEGNSNRAY